MKNKIEVGGVEIGSEEAQRAKVAVDMYDVTSRTKSNLTSMFFDVTHHGISGKAFAKMITTAVDDNIFAAFGDTWCLNDWIDGFFNEFAKRIKNGAEWSTPALDMSEDEL